MDYVQGMMNVGPKACKKRDTSARVDLNVDRCMTDRRKCNNRRSMNVEFSLGLNIYAFVP